jgi:hypothetical protein
MACLKDKHHNVIVNGTTHTNLSLVSRRSLVLSLPA